MHLLKEKNPKRNPKELVFIKSYSYLCNDMGQATLTYNLDDFDDNQAFMRAAKSTDMALAIWEFVYNTKKSFEYQIDESDEKSQDLLDKVYDKFWEILNDKGIKPDDLIR